MPETQKQLRGWCSKSLKGKRVEVSANDELVVVSLGQRITPEIMGGRHQVGSLPRRLSDNRRMILTEILLSPESAIELHAILGKTLKSAGLAKKNFYEELDTNWAMRFFTRFVLATLDAAYFQQQHWMTITTKKIKAPA